MRVRTGAAAILVLSAIAWGTTGVGGAVGAPVESGSFEFENTYLVEDCGRPLEWHEQIEGSYVIKDATPRTGGEFFRLKQQVEAHITVSDPETGAYFTVEWRTLFAELPGTLVPGSTTEVVFRSIEAGVWDLWRGSSGEVQYRSTGAISIEYVFDTGGDGVPGGQILEGRLIRAAGNLPTFDADLCALALPLLD
jgi:hypothetical protein